jgi:8-oxo-dGTP diphosphatase
VGRTSQAEGGQTAAVGAVVVDRAGRLLLIRRGRPPSAGSWTLPGGRLERGESLEAAVAREVCEETALEVHVVCKLCAVDIAREGFAFRVHEYLTVPLAADAPRAGDDASEARWVRRTELTALRVRDDAIAVIDQGLAEAFARGLVDPSARQALLSSGPMRTSHQCPKCGHGEVLFVPQIADRDDRDVVRPLSLHVKHYDYKDDEIGKLQAYVCRSCGYTELYTGHASALVPEKLPGARVLKRKE